MNAKEIIKQKVAKENNFDSFEKAIRNTFNRELLESEMDFINKLFDESMEAYAKQQGAEQQKRIEELEHIEKMYDEDH